MGGLTEIPPGELGAVVTYLEMTGRPKLRPLPVSPLRMKPWPDVTPAQYRLLFERVGGRWLWFSRLRMDDAALAANIGELHAVLDRAGAEVGMVELDFGEPGQCLIRFLGLVPELAGKGHGEWLFAQTLALAWRKGIGRVHVNTCTLDHPAALPAYLKAGFKAYKRAFESFPDPRLTGLLPRNSAPQIPLIGGSRLG
ncbi:MAG TPA: GNAT family N-acetyltransferase [Allosphingosinicella sp.]|nr:GNAT family N-acetyltransferase [Allosphingosinicella sp.]